MAPVASTCLRPLREVTIYKRVHIPMPQLVWFVPGRPLFGGEEAGSACTWCGEAACSPYKLASIECLWGPAGLIYLAPCFTPKLPRRQLTRASRVAAWRPPQRQPACRGATAESRAWTLWVYQVRDDRTQYKSPLQKKPPSYALTLGHIARTHNSNNPARSYVIACTHGRHTSAIHGLRRFREQVHDKST